MARSTLSPPLSLRVHILFVAAALLSAGCTAELGGNKEESSSGNSRADSTPPGSMAVDDPLGTPPPPGTTGPQLFLLTQQEIAASLTALFGPTSLDESELQPNAVSSGYSSIGSGQASLSSLGVELVETLALRVVEAAFETDTAAAALVGCSPTSAADPCVRTFLSRIGRQAWRRPLSEEELTRLTDLTSSVAELFDGDPNEGMRYAVASILQSPRFLYQIVNGQLLEDGETLQLTDYELASKLSYFLLQQPPSDELLTSADQGALTDPASYANLVEDLLADSSAWSGVDVFCEEYLRLAALQGANKSPELFPDVDDALLADMETETVSFCSRAARGTDFRDAFVASETIINGRLSDFYGMGLDASADFSPSPLPPERVGVLTSAGLTAAHAHADRTSPTLRGRFIRETLLCQKVPDPPEDVIFDTIEESEDRPDTLRGRLEQHATDPACSTCHNMMDPLGFALEHFDAVGAFRAEEAGLPVDASGELDGVPFNSATELTNAVIAHENFPTCVGTQLFRRATGRVESTGDQPELDAAGASFASDNFEFRSVLRSIVLSDGFRNLTIPAL